MNDFILALKSALDTKNWFGALIRREKKLMEGAGQKAHLEPKEAENKANLVAEEAKPAKGPEKAAGKSIKEPFASDMILPENEEPVSGSVTLLFDPDVHYDEISQVINSLRKNASIRIGSSGGSVDKGSWVVIYILNPTPLYHLLYELPFVGKITREGDKIHLTIPNKSTDQSTK